MHLKEEHNVYKNGLCIVVNVEYYTLCMVQEKREWHF